MHANIIDFIIMFLSTFLGFFSAMLLQKYNDKAKRKSLLKSIINDLRKVCEYIEDQEKQSDNSIRFYFNPYPAFSWDCLIHTDGYTFLNQNEKLSCIFEAYKMIYELNKLEEVNYTLYFSGNMKKQELIYENIIKKRRALVKYITTYCLNIKI